MEQVMTDEYALIKSLFEQSGTEKDYEKYLNTRKLLACQKNYDDLVNRDELQFQIVHQVEELWMKLIAYSLEEAVGCIKSSQRHRAITLLKRASLTLDLMTEQLRLLESMSPKDYQTIRLELGNGSGQESPGFRVLLHLEDPIWQAFQENCLEKENLTLREIYDSRYRHGETYLLAEGLVEFSERFSHFRFCHLQLIYRSIGPSAKSLKGRPIELLEGGVKHRFFEPLWIVRAEMTDTWGQHYGVKRDSLNEK